MEKNKKKKFRDIRNAVVMMCVMVAMMSTASYAWFTLSASPTVTNMQMTATTTGGGLKVANDEGTGEPAAFYGSINIKDTDTKVLKPVTPGSTTGKLTFKSPIYTGNTVTGLADIPDSELEQYVAKYEFWVKSMADETSGGNVGVGIICGAATQTADLEIADNDAPVNVEGSLVRENAAVSTKEVKAPYAVRVGFVINTATNGADPTSGDITIWEPNSDVKATDAGLAPVAEGVPKAAAADLISNSDGTIVTGGAGNVSDVMFELPKGGAAKVTMFVWLEGSDNECGDKIQAGSLEAQIQFTEVELATTTP